MKIRSAIAQLKTCRATYRLEELVRVIEQTSHRPEVQRSFKILAQLFTNDAHKTATFGENLTEDALKLLHLH